MAGAQGYHVDYPKPGMGEITRIGKQNPDEALTVILPANTAGEPIRRGYLADFGALVERAGESLVGASTRRNPQDFGMADTPRQHVGGINGTETAGGGHSRRVAFRHGGKRRLPYLPPKLPEPP